VGIIGQTTTIFPIQSQLRLSHAPTIGHFSPPGIDSRILREMTRCCIATDANQASFAMSIRVSYRQSNVLVGQQAITHRRQ